MLRHSPKVMLGLGTTVAGGCSAKDGGASRRFVAGDAHRSHTLFFTEGCNLVNAGALGNRAAALPFFLVRFGSPFSVGILPYPGDIFSTFAHAKMTAKADEHDPIMWSVTSSTQLKPTLNRQISTPKPDTGNCTRSGVGLQSHLLQQTRP